MTSRRAAMIAPVQMPGCSTDLHLGAVPTSVNLGSRLLAPTSVGLQDCQSRCTDWQVPYPEPAETPAGNNSSS
jgi:hypothetical protein